MQETRTKKTKRNIAVSYLDYAVTFLFQFVSRTIIVQTLGEQYLGLSSLFVSILQVLNMAELGFSNAIVFNMYKPLAENDEERVCQLLNYYKRVYRSVSLVIIVVGSIIAPFIPKLIHGTYPKQINIYILYYLYLINTAVSYSFFAYKASLLSAMQRMDLTKFSYAIIHMIQYVLQILSLLIFKNYYLFVGLMICGTIAKNILVSYVANKKFPQFQCRGQISRDIKSDIISRVKGVLIGNISGVTYTTFDSIILSTYLGLTTVAIYNNYLVVVNGVMALITIIRNAMQASVGNSVAIESKRKNYEDMLLWQFLFSGIGATCMTCMICLFQPFMKIWMGEAMLLSNNVIILLSTWFYVCVIQHSFFLYLGGNGLWWEMRWPYICSTAFNLIMNIVLGKFFGVFGIVFSTLAASVIFGLFWQCYLIFKLYYNTSMKTFQLRQLLYFIVCCSSCLLAYFIIGRIRIDGIVGLIAKGIASVLVSLILQSLCYYKTQVFKKSLAFLKKVIS